MVIALSNVFTNPGQLYNGFYPKRPVWGILATTNGSTPNTTNNFFYTFAKSAPLLPQSFDYMAGSSQPNVALGRRIGVNEVNSSFYFAGSTSQLTSQTYSPTASFIGCQNVAQTGANIYFDAYDTGLSQFYNTSARNTVFVSSGVVIGEPNWNQTFDLVAYDGKIMKLPLNAQSTWVTTPNINADFFFASNAVYAGYGSPTGTSAGLGVASMTSDATTGSNASARRNRGMICHNRRSGKLAYLEATTTTHAYRLHIVDLQNKIGAATTTQEILTWINAAVAAGSSRYNFYDITFPSMTQNYLRLQMEMGRLVLCDDDTLWVHFWDKPASSTSGPDRLYRCTDTATYTPALVDSQNTTTSHGIESGEVYGSRHMNSDDNSRVAIYNVYSQYLAGINAFIVNTYTAVAAGANEQWMGYAVQTSTGAYPIVPVGGNAFFAGDITANQDGASGARGHYFNTAVLSGQTQSFSLSVNNSLPTISQSTAYQSWVPIKIQPTLEWKPTND